MANANEKSKSSYNGTYAPLIDHIIKIYGLEKQNNRIADFTGLAQSTISDLRTNSKKGEITSLQLFLFYICAGEKYNDNLHVFFESDPEGINLLYSVFNDKKNRIDFSKISYDSLGSEKIDNFKKNLKDRIKKIGPQTDSLQDDDKRFYETVKEKFPSVFSASLRDSVSESDQEHKRNEYKKRNNLLRLIHSLSDYEYDPIDYNEPQPFDEDYEAFAMYIRENFDTELMNTYIQVKLDCERTISEGNSTEDTFFKYAVNFFETEHYTRALKNFHIAAEDKKDAKAFLVLGYWYLLGGLGVSQDTNLSIDMFKKGMDVSPKYTSFPDEPYHLVASLFLGSIYFYGTGTSINRQRALEYYKYWLKSPKALDKPSNCTDCFLYILYAKCLLYGYGTEPDVDAAKLIFTKIHNDDCDCSTQKKILYYLYI